MGMVLAVNGKGGTGKTTVASLMISHIASRGRGSILAVDADPNYTLASAFGMRLEHTMVGVIDETSLKKANIPGGMSKDRFIALRVQESIVEGDDFDLLAMGRPEGPGCYCYVNNVLRDILSNVMSGYDFLVIDNAAGMEHISRRTERVIDRFVLVSDYSIIGVRSCGQIYSLAKELGIKIGRAFLIVNKCSGTLEPLAKEIESSGIELAGAIDYNEELVCLSVANRSIRELKDAGPRDSMAKIMEKILL